jgi:hypothetical protein
MYVLGVSLDSLKIVVMEQMLWLMDPLLAFHTAPALTFESKHVSCLVPSDWL